MDAVSLILSALTAGATAALQDTTGDAIKDAYAGLKALLRRKFGGDEAAQAKLNTLEEAPGADATTLTPHVLESGADRDEQLLTLARELMAYVDPNGTRVGKYNVAIKDGEGAVVGDYATVFQVFTNSPPALASYLRVPQFRSLVDQRTQGFVGRDFVFERIDEVLGGAEFPSGYLVIRGEPGIGKTAIAATLVARHGYVHHFNIAPENIRSTRQFLENICAQLIVRFELDHVRLPPYAGEDSGFLSQLLGEAAGRAQQPIVVVVDALDEAEDSGPPDANRLFLPRVLPAGVFFVLTTRDEADFRLDVDHGIEIWIREEDPGNRADIARYIGSFIERHADAMAARLGEWGLGRDEFVSQLTGLSEGNFMYLVHVLPDIASGRLSRDTVGAIQGLPRGLTRYYQRHWRDMKDADPEKFARAQRPVLCFLAVSREPMTVDQLRDRTRLEPGTVRGVLREWHEFLNEEAGQFRIYHRSFADFLDEHEELRYYHEQIAMTALAKIPGFYKS